MTKGRPPHDDTLTPAEWRVVDAVRHGLSNPAIATRLGVSADAVKFHVSNALHKLGFADRKALRRWDGVRRSSALFDKEVIMEQPIALRAIGQIARTVTDIAEARRWYGDVLGLEHLYSFGNLAFFRCGGVRLMLSQDDGAVAASILYFRVDDIRTAHVQLRDRGVQFTHAPHLVHRHEDGTEEWMAFFTDNELRPLGIMAQIAPA